MLNDTLPKMQVLPGTQVETLYQLLLDTHTRFSLRQMLRFQMNETLDRIAGGETLSEIVFNLLAWAEREQRIEELIHAAAVTGKSQRLEMMALQLGRLSINGNPSIEFDWVNVRAGDFLMGSDPEVDPAAYAREEPQHEIYVPNFRIARTPVTNAQYEHFVDATGHRVPKYWVDGKIPDGKGQHPVIEVSLADALSFCAWAGVRMPTEAEWEKAARGTSGRIYPWGNEQPTADHANFAKRINDTTPVDAYPLGVGPYGCLDMVGNAWEWTVSLWGGTEREPGFDYPYYARSDREDPDVDATEPRVLRGGCYTRGSRLIRAAYRYRILPEYRRAKTGFRVVDTPIQSG